MNILLSTFLKGIEKSGINPVRISIVSDIPFPPGETKELGVDFFQIPRGRAIAFGSGMKLANPDLKLIPVVGDLMTIGGNHFVHAARRNIDMLIICINNYIYKKIAGKQAPVKDQNFSVYSIFEKPFNIPHLSNSCGASYIARWTLFHTAELIDSLAEALNKPGLSTIEILAPGADYYSGFEKIDLDLARFYYENSVIKNGENPRKIEITDDSSIAVGRFVDKDRPTFFDIYNAQLSKVLKDKFTPYGVKNV
ncbi:MAG: thiamine pyrophosphate-dependent enzyme [candidate division WOR-3 bacterium]